MRKKESKEKGGLCCPHCADSKFPCVNMEMQMRKEQPEKPQSKKDEKG